MRNRLKVIIGLISLVVTINLISNKVMMDNQHANKDRDDLMNHQHASKDHDDLMDHQHASKDHDDLMNHQHASKDHDDLRYINYSQEYSEDKIAHENYLNDRGYIYKKFLIEEKNFCKRNPEIKLLVYVHSAISKVTERNITRNTWGAGLKTGVPMAVVYVVGRAKNTREEEIVKAESRLYGDIVQGNYTDQYNLLSYKALSALYWVTKNCAHVPWTMHVDDDLMVNNYRLMNRILMIESDSSLTGDNMYCHVFLHPPVLRKGKWKVSFKRYPHKYYPKFCQGPLWFIRTKTIAKLLNAVNSTEFWWIDDLYTTGFLAISANIERLNVPFIALSKKKKTDMLNKIAWLSVDEDRYDWWKKVSSKWRRKYISTGKWNGDLSVS